MSEVEALPEVAVGWKRAKLRDVAEKPQYGLTASAAKSGPVQFLRITDITERGVDWGSVPYCASDDKTINACLLKSGDIVFARIGATTGKSYLINDPPHAVFASYLIRVRTHRDLDPAFLSFFFKSDDYWEQVNANKHANLKKGVNGSILSDLVVPVPPKIEQERIAEVLGTVQQAMEQQERLIRSTTELKQALMQKLFTEGLRGEAQKETEIGAVPESWEVKPLGDLFDAQLGKMLSPKARRGSTPLPYLRNKNVQWDGIETDDLHLMDFDDREAAKFRLKAGDLLICEGGEVGRTALWKDQVEVCYYQKALHRLRPKHGRMRPEYMAYWMRFAFQMNNIYGVTGTRTTIAHLPEIKLLPLLLPLPSLDEQDDIVRAIDQVDKKLTLARKRMTTLQDLFRTLLHELMTGKVRVNQNNLSTNDSTQKV